MDKLKAIEIFVAIAEGGSLTAAARGLGLSVPTIVRSLAWLERSLGVTLFVRTTRRVALTEDGRRYLATCRAGLDTLREGERALREQQGKAIGRLTITASVQFGRSLVVPFIEDFLRRNPQVSINLLLLDRVVDLVEEGVDIAFRIAPLPDSTLHAVRIGEVVRVTCASPGYLRRRPALVHPVDVKAHDVVLFQGLSPSAHFVFASGGRMTRIAVSPRLTTNACDAALAACRVGVGVGQFLSYMVEQDLRDRTLRRVLTDFEPPRIPASIVYAHSLAPSTRVRVFVDEAVPAFRAALAR